MGLSVGASSVVSRRFGEEKEIKGGWLQRTFGFGSTFIFANNCYCLPHPFIRIDFLGADENVRNLSISYVEIWFLAPFFAFAMVASSLMRAMGDIARPGYLMALSALLQIAFGPALIFGAGEFSGFGLIGAAIAFVSPEL